MKNKKRKKYQKGIQSTVLMILVRNKFQSQQVTTTVNIQAETSFTKGAISQALYELHKTGWIIKPEDGGHNDGRWMVNEEKWDVLCAEVVTDRPKHIPLLCAHLEDVSEDDKRQRCVIKKTIIGDPRTSCDVLCETICNGNGWEKNIVPMCPGYCSTQSTPVTVLISENKLTVWEAKEIGGYRESNGSIRDPESTRCLPKLFELDCNPLAILSL